MVKYVLSCDGGGVRGVAAVRFLRHLEQTIGPLHKFFDMVAGTSAGAIIAAKISVTNASMATLERAYRDGDLDAMFDKSCLDRALGTFQLEPKYDGKEKFKIICGYFKNQTLGDATIPLLIPCYDITKRKSKFFKSWEDSQVLCCDVVTATTSAPAYFPSYKIGNSEFIDGGVVINNPSLSAYIDAKKKWPNEEIKVLSLGTGHPSNPLNGAQDWGGIQWIANGLVSVFTDQSHIDYQMRELLGPNYFRVDSKLTVEDETLDNTKTCNIKVLERLGDQWWDQYQQNLLQWIQK